MNSLSRLLPLLGLLACGGADTGSADTATTDTATTDTAVPEALTGTKGSIAIVHLGADAKYDELLTIHSIFSNDDGGLINFAACGIVAGGPCVPTLPGVGETLDLNVNLDFFTTLAFYELTAPITVAGQPLKAVRDRAGEYSGHSVMLDSFPTGAVDLSWGAPLAPYSNDTAGTMPDKLIITAPDVTKTVPSIKNGETLSFAWTPGTTGDMYLRVKAGETQQITHLEDNGSYALDLDQLGLPEKLGSFVVTLGRWTNTRIDAAGNDVVLHALSETWFYGTRFNLDGYTFLAPSNSCSDANTSGYTSDGDYWFDLSADGLTSTLDLPKDNTWDMYETPGTDGVFKVKLEANTPFNATAQEANGDSSLYLINSCSGALVDTFVVGTDLEVTNGAETLSYTPDTSGDFYLVVDNYAADKGDLTSLHIEGTVH